MGLWKRLLRRQYGNSTEGGEYPARRPILTFMKTKPEDKTAVTLLSKNGFRPEAKGFDKMKALHWAARNGHEAVVQYLLRSGADVAATGDGVIALHQAAVGGHVGVVKLLLENGASISAVNESGQTAMHEALLKDPIAVVEYLKAQGAEIDGTKEIKAKSGQEVRSRYLDYAAGPSTSRHGEVTAPHRATMDRDVAMVQQLWASSAYSADQALASAGYTVGHRKAAVVPPLAKKYFDINSVSGRTAIHQAVMNKQRREVELLIKNGADLDAKDGLGMTPLHLAAMDRRNKAMVELLIRSGADCSLKDVVGRTALDEAAQTGDTETWRLIRERMRQAAPKKPPRGEALQQTSSRRRDIGQELLHSYDTGQEDKLLLASLVISSRGSRQ